MVLEIDVGRLIAPYVGTSLYTWTGVIGVVLAGMTIGAFAGGGAYVFPRYIHATRSGSIVETYEIDPAVTEIARRELGSVPEKTILNHMDARREINLRVGKKPDVVFGGVFRDLTVSSHPTTLEFYQELSGTISDSGYYIFNMVDKKRNGLFFQSNIKTLQKVVPHVAAIRSDEESKTRNTFVIIAGQKSVSGLGKEFGSRWRRAEELDLSRGVVLTDDFAPVEQMLLPVLIASAQESK